MLKYVSLANVGPAPAMEMHLASRLNLITGDNGLGKSFLLDVAWWCLTRKWPQDLNTKLTSGYAARPTDVRKRATIKFGVESKTRTVSYESTYVPRDQSWLGKAGRPWNPGLVIYAHADGGFSVWDPARNYWKRKGNVDVQERLPGYVFSPKEVWDGLKVEIDGRQTQVCNGLLIDWASWIREGGELASSMEAVLQELSPSRDPLDQLRPGPLTRITIDDSRDIPSLQTPYSKTVPILHASSGVRRIVALAYMMLWSWHEHRIAAAQLGEDSTSQVVFLIDEIESHLHPRWQRSILGSLLKLVSILHDKARAQIVSATHSALILASVEPSFDPKHDAWFDLDFDRKASDGQVRLRKRAFVRHGDVSRWLTSDAFDFRQPTSLEAEEALDKALELLRRIPRPSLKEFETVDSQLRKVLGDTDPFWVRWGQNLERLRERK
jgi:hypothetical protein